MPEPTFPRTPVVRRFIAAVLALGLVAGVFGVAPRAGATQQPDTIAVGDQAPDFTLESTDGETYRLADMRGDKNLVVIFFRGTW